MHSAHALPSLPARPGRLHDRRSMRALVPVPVSPASPLSHARTIVRPSCEPASDVARWSRASGQRAAGVLEPRAGASGRRQQQAEPSPSTSTFLLAPPPHFPRRSGARMDDGRETTTSHTAVLPAGVQQGADATPSVSLRSAQLLSASDLPTANLAASSAGPPCASLVRPAQLSRCLAVRTLLLTVVLCRLRFAGQQLARWRPVAWRLRSLSTCQPQPGPSSCLSPCFSLIPDPLRPSLQKQPSEGACPHGGLGPLALPEGQLLPQLVRVASSLACRARNATQR